MGAEKKRSTNPAFGTAVFPLRTQITGRSDAIGELHESRSAGAAILSLINRRKLMKNIVLVTAVALFSVTAFAQQPPKFLRDSYPTHALQAALGARAVLEGSQAKLDAKTRELIALGVAAQIPCTYCIHAHTRNARAHGASDAEIREAVATAATVRHWSTVLNGMAVDFEAFKAEFGR